MPIGKPPPASHARASSNAGLGPRLARHLLLAANSETVA